MTDAARRPEAPLAPNELLSRLIDGDAAAHDAEASCRHWQQGGQVRETWHCYQLIGDVLRSDELASSGDHDARFLARLRTQLAAEPVPLAPAPLPRPADARAPVPREAARRWMLPAAAVAAGFMVVGAAVVVLQPTSRGFDALEREPIAAAPRSAGGLSPRVERVAAPASGQTLRMDGQLIRDARLDAYFEAHRGALGAVPTATPGGALRSVEILVPER